MTAEEEETEKLSAPADFDGPTSKRGCTDVLCSLILICTWVAMTGVGLHALREGDYRVVTYPMDYDGNICGTDFGSVDMTEYNYLYPVNLYSGGVCVKECPSLSEIPVDIFTLVTYDGIFQVNGSMIPFDEIEVADYSNATIVKTCTLDTCYPNNNPVESWQSEGINEGAGYAFYAVNTRSYMNRCIMTGSAIGYLKNFTKDFAEEAAAETAGSRSSLMTNAYSDIYTARKYVMGFGFCLAVVVGFLYSFFLRIPGVLLIMVWGSLLCALAMLGYVGYYAYNEANEWRNEDPKKRTDRQILVLQTMGYVIWGLGGLLFLSMIALRRRIQLALGIVREAAKALADMPALIVFPIIQCAGLVVFMIVWMVYVVHLASLGTISPTDIELNGVTVTVRSFKYDNEVEYAGWYLLFCFFWTTQFIIALGEIIIAMSVAKWYFSRDKSAIGNCTLVKSICESTFFHAGTAAFGSLIIAIIQMIRAFLTYIQRHAQKSGNKIAVAILTCLQCCMWCLEKIMKFLNRNAYIQTAIFGTSFCTSAKAAFFLILRNVARVGTLTAISEIVVLIGKVFISVMTGGSCYIVIDRVLGDELYSPVAPALFVAIVSFLIGSMFMDIFSMVIGTTLQCFIADEEMFGDSDGCFASDSLKSYIDSNGGQKSTAISP